MKNARFPVFGRFKAGAPVAGTMVVERAAGLIWVRAHKSHKKHELPLNAVAEFIVWHVTKKELAETRARKKKERAARRKAS